MNTGRRPSIYVGLSVVAWAIALPALLVSNAFTFPDFDSNLAWGIVLTTVGYFFVERFALRVSIGPHNLNYVATEAPLLLGTILLSPVGHVAVRFVAIAAATMWRVRRNAAVSTVGAGLANGSSGAAQVAVFTAVTSTFDWRNSYTLRGAAVLALAWAACTLVDLGVPTVGRWIAGQHVTLENTRAAVSDLVNLSMPTMWLVVWLASSRSIIYGLLFCLPLVMFGRHGKPVIDQLTEGTTYKALHKFFRLLQQTTSEDVEKALELASTATKTRHVQLVILEREGIDRQLESALTIGPNGRVTQSVGELPEQWRGVLSNGFPATFGERATSSVVCPLIVNTHTVGLLVCSEPFDAVKGITETTIDVATSLAGNLSLWLEQDRLLNELRRDMEARTHQALHDPLTGLLNRRGFHEAWDVHGRDQTSVAVLIVDLDSFKETNSYLGHAGGDSVLCEAARRLRNVLPPRAQIARLGGDEFGAFIPDIRKGGGQDLADAGELGAQLRRALLLPFTVEDSTVTVAGSIGIAVSPHHGNDLSVLMKHADDAMFAAKDESGVAVFANASYGHDRETSAIDGWRLKAAIDNRDIECWFQPIVDMHTYRVAGFEALARWRDRDRIVMPQEFIPLAERTGHIHALTAALMAEAFANVQRWSEHTGRKLDVGINISPLSVSNPDLREGLIAALRRTGLDPGCVHLEVTEGRMFKDPLRATVHLNHLRETGVKISLDDYGTGASTHEWLFRMAPDQIKIDRLFVKDMCTDERARGIVELDVQTGLKFKASVVAEGIETTAHWNTARELGVSLAQGYLLGRPKPASEIMDWLIHEEPQLEALINLAATLDPIDT